MAFFYLFSALRDRHAPNQAPSYASIQDALQTRGAVLPGLRWIGPGPRVVRYAGRPGRENLTGRLDARPSVLVSIAQPFSVPRALTGVEREQLVSSLFGPAFADTTRSADETTLRAHAADVEADPLYGGISVEPYQACQSGPLSFWSSGEAARTRTKEADAPLPACGSADTENNSYETLLARGYEIDPACENSIGPDTIQKPCVPRRKSHEPWRVAAGLAGLGLLTLATVYVVAKIAERK